MLPFLKRFGNKDGLLFFFLLFLVIVLRIFVLTDFSFQYTDSDQAIMWQGLKDYSKGEFHEPRFYGQAYNSMLEAFLAVPLYKSGIPPYKALPVITTLLAIFPFILISLLVFLKRSPKLALLILSIPLVLPVEYSLITSLPRGFVTGIFASSFACLGIFYPKSKRVFLSVFFAAALGFSLNANSVLLSVPCLAYLFLENIRNKQFYIYAGIGGISGLAIHFFANYFYVTHPYNNTHEFPLAFSFADLFASLPHLSWFFNDVTPLFWKAGILSLALFIILAFLFYRKKEYKKAAIVAFIPVLILLSLGVNKIHDGAASVYFSYSRMYLALPVLLAFSISLFSSATSSGYFYLCLVFPVSFFGYQVSILDNKIAATADPNVFNMVTVAETDKIIAECNALQTVCKEHQVELIVVAGHEHYNFYNYGCATCTDEFPNTLAPTYERRTWRLLEDEKKVYHTVLVIDAEKNRASEFVKRLEIDSSFYLIENNNKTTMELLNAHEIWCREYK